MADAAGSVPVVIAARLSLEQQAQLAAVDPRLALRGVAGGYQICPLSDFERGLPITPTGPWPDDRATLLADAEVLITARVPLDLDQIAPRLRWVQFLSAGVDRAWRPCLDRMDAQVTTVAGGLAAPIAEFVLAMLLHFAKDWPRFQAQREARVWRKFWLRSLAGRSVLIVGYGQIGHAVAVRARACEMRVVGVRRRPEAGFEGGEPADRIVPPERLLDELPQADYVVLALPATPATRDSFGARELAAMKPDAVLINVGRGETVDEPALIAALQKGQIAGAGLDVTATEPLPPDSPLWTLPNVFLSPHMAGDTDRYMAGHLHLIADNLRRYLAGEPLRNLVDKERCY